MKKLLLTTICLAFAIFSFSQQISRYVVASGGNYSTDSLGNSLSLTIGEPMVATFIGTGLVLTQGFQQPSITYGCTDSVAINYNSLATVDDSSCVYCINGCIDPTAVNYDSLATCDNGSCIAPVSGCQDPNAYNYNSNANVGCGGTGGPSGPSGPTPGPTSSFSGYSNMRGTDWQRQGQALSSGTDWQDVNLNACGGQYSNAIGGTQWQDDGFGGTTWQDEL